MSGSRGRIPFRGATPGALLVRRLLPATIGLPLLAGAFVLVGLTQTHLSVAAAIAIGAVGIAGATGMLLWTAATLDRTETQRRRAEAALRRSEEQHRALARNFPDGAIVLFDRDLRYLIADGVGLAAVGLSAELMEGRTLWEVFPPDVCKAVEPTYRAALDGRESTFEYEYGHRAYWIRVAPVTDDETGVVWGGAVMVADVTERKKVELELREANERFERIFDNAPIGEAIVAPDGRFLHVNAALCGIVGYTRDELLARTFWEITHPDDIAANRALVAGVLDGDGSTYELEKRYVNARGEVVWGQLSATLIRTESGEPQYFISQVQDVTERRRQEEALRESEGRLAEAQQTALIGSSDWDVAGDTVMWSRELYKLFGVDPDGAALDYESYLQLIHADDRAHLQDVVRRAMETGEPYTVEHRVVHPGNAVRWIQGRGVVEQANGSTVRLHGTAQDITDRVEAELRLREAENRYRTLVEQLPLTTYVRPLEMSEVNIYCSPNVEEILGYSAEEWLTDPDLLRRIVHPDDVDYVVANGERVRRTGKPFRGEYRYIHRDGHTVWVQDETYLIRDEAGRPAGVQGYLMDITERKHAEEERDRLREQLHHAQKIEAIGQLAGGVAHEFNNTLTAITAYSSLMLEQLEPGDPLRRDVESVMGSAERAVSLTRQLLAFGRKQVLQPRPIDLNDVVETSIDLMRPLVDPGILLTTKLDTEIPVTEADPTQIEQVIVNLVLNARDAITGAGSIVVETGRVTLDQTRAAEHDVAAGEYLSVLVTDTGRGMDETTRARMFEPFFTTKDEGKGTGLGLSTAYGIVRQGGGFLTVESEHGSGTTMGFHLPCHPARLEAAVEAGMAPSLAPSSTRTALVVDDEQSVREVCTALLQRLGFNVRTAVDGRAALEQLRHIGPVDLLLTDIVMPRLSGVELGHRVTAMYPHTTVVHMSGFPGDLTGAGDELLFLQKPFTAAELEELLTPPDARVAEVTLTVREREVLRLLAEGETNEDVGRRLSISAAAVQEHVRSAMEKLDAETRTHAVATALRRSLIS